MNTIVRQTDQQGSTEEQAPNILLRIDTKQKQKQIVLTNISQRFEVGPFNFEVGISGDYELSSRTGFITCELDVTKPFDLKQTLYLIDSTLKLKYEASIMKLLHSFGLSSNSELNKYFDIDIAFQLAYDFIQKQWNITGSLHSDNYKFTIFGKDFGISEIGYMIGGKKGKISQNKAYFIFNIAGLPLRVEHSFGKQEYLLEGHMDVIPFGKLIADLTNGIDSLDVSSVLNNIQLKDIDLKFKNFSNFSIKASCPIGSCQITIKDGRFKSGFSPPKDFSFKSITGALEFLDVLGLNTIKIEAGNSGQGIKIDGVLPISKIKPVADLATMLKSPASAFDLAFALSVVNWKSIQAKLSFLKNLRFNDAVTLNSLDLIIRPSATAPEFGISGEVAAKICSKDFIFRASFTVGTTIKFTAEMVGTWDNPFGLKNSYIKDLLLEITPSGFGVAGGIKLGDMKAEAAVLFDIVNPARNMVHFQLESFQLAKVLSVFDINLPSEIARILNEINIQLMRADLVPPGGIQMGEKYYEQGFASELKCQIFGFKAHFLLEFRKLQFRLFGQIDQIKIPHILTLKSSKDAAKGPSVDVLAALSLKSHFKIDGALSILDLVDREVYGEVDANGIYFKTRGAITIFGHNFIEGSFLLRAGLMRITDSFLLQVSFKTDTKVFQIIQNTLKDLAKKATKPFNEAQAKLNETQQAFQVKKQALDVENQKQRDRFQNQKKEYDRVFDKHQKEAKAALDRERARASQVLEQEKRRAQRTMQNAKADAERAHENQQRRASQVLNDERANASRKLQSARRDIADTFRGPKEKVDSILSTIRDYEDAPWYEFWKKAALAGLYPAYGTAKGVLIAAEKTAQATTVAAEQIYKASLSAANATYSGILKASKKTASLAISAADSTYSAALSAADAVYSNMVKAAEATYSAAITTAKGLANKAGDAYIAMIDAAFSVAKKAFDTANLAVEVAKGVLTAAEAAAKYALQFLGKLVNGLANILVFRQLFFEFDVKKEKITIRIDLIIMGKTLKANLEISFKEIYYFLATLANKIWDFISGKN